MTSSTESVTPREMQYFGESPEENHRSWFRNAGDTIREIVEHPVSLGVVGGLNYLSAVGQELQSPHFPEKMEVVGKFIEMASRANLTPETIAQLAGQLMPKDINEVAAAGLFVAGTCWMSIGGLKTIKNAWESSK